MNLDDLTITIRADSLARAREALDRLAATLPANRLDPLLIPIPGIMAAAALAMLPWVSEEQNFRAAAAAAAEEHAIRAARAFEMERHNARYRAFRAVHPLPRHFFPRYTIMARKIRRMFRMID